MAYLLNERVFLDDCCFCEQSIVFNARASITEVNKTLETIYGMPLELLKGRKYNSKVYGVNGSEVRYIEGPRLNVCIIPVNEEIKNRLEEKLRKL